MEDQLISGIEDLLFEMKDRQFLPLSNDDSEFKWKCANTAVELGLIRDKSKYTFVLTADGIEANSQGGYRKYRKMQEEDEEMNKRLRLLQIEELRGSIFQIKHWWVFLLLNGIISLIIALIVSIVSK